MAVQLPGKIEDHLPKGELVQEAIQQDCQLHPEGQHEEIEGHAAPAVSPQRCVEETQAKDCHDGNILEVCSAKRCREGGGEAEKVEGCVKWEFYRTAAGGDIEDH